MTRLALGSVYSDAGLHQGLGKNLLCRAAFDDSPAEVQDLLETDDNIEEEEEEEEDQTRRLSQKQDLSDMQCRGWCQARAEMMREIKLIRAVLLVATDTSCAERGFSLMNTVHSATRNRQHSETIDLLMRIKLLGPPMAKFDAGRIHAKWRNEVKRRRIKGDWDGDGDVVAPVFEL